MGFWQRTEQVEQFQMKPVLNLKRMLVDSAIVLLNTGSSLSDEETGTSVFQSRIDDRSPPLESLKPRWILNRGNRWLEILQSQTDVLPTPHSRSSLVNFEADDKRRAPPQLHSPLLSKSPYEE